jgi:hypothetical protein
MWSEDQLSFEILLKNNSIEEMFIGYINNEPATVMILQEEDSTFYLVNVITRIKKLKTKIGVVNNESSCNV